LFFHPNPWRVLSFEHRKKLSMSYVHFRGFRVILKNEAMFYSNYSLSPHEKKLPFSSITKEW
jgi:hypothetical protein